MTYVGIDIGGSKVRVVAQHDRRRSAVASEGIPASYPDLLVSVRRLVARVAGEQVTAVGCGLPGTSDGQSARFVPALPWIEGQPVRADLERTLGAPCLLGVDGHLTLLAEATEGAARGRTSAILVALGTGIGGAFMLGGRIWRGAQGSAGSWGWLPAEGGGTDRRHGQLEVVASGAALSALAAPRTARELVAATRAGEPEARATIDLYGERLGRGIAALASVTDPEIVLVGGGLSEAWDVVGPPVERCMERFASPDGQRVPVRPAELGADAAVVGAAVLAERGEEAWL